MRSRRRRAVTGLVVAVTTLAGCGSTPGVAADLMDPQLVGFSAHVLVDSNAPGATPVTLTPEAGRLRFYAPGKCLVIDPGTGFGSPRQGTLIKTRTDKPSWFSAVWPRGTTVVQEDDRYGLHLLDGTTLWVGDLIIGTGGAWDGWLAEHLTYGLSPDCVGAHLSQIVGPAVDHDPIVPEADPSDPVASPSPSE